MEQLLIHLADVYGFTTLLLHQQAAFQDLTNLKIIIIC